MPYLNKFHQKELLEFEENSGILDAEDVTQLFLLDKDQFDGYYQEKHNPTAKDEDEGDTGSEKAEHGPTGIRKTDREETQELNHSQRIANQQKKVDDLTKQYNTAKAEHTR